MGVIREKRVRLEGVLEHSASSARIGDDGNLIIEFYDFGPDAEQWFGNDVAFRLMISSKSKDEVISRLTSGAAWAKDSAERDDLLLRLIADQFPDYYAVKGWLEEQEIAFEREFDSWA